MEYHGSQPYSEGCENQYGPICCAIEVKDAEHHTYWTRINKPSSRMGEESGALVDYSEDREKEELRNLRRETESNYRHQR